MDEEARRRVTEWMGEEWVNTDPFKGWVNVFASNRTFTTWQDLGDCVRRLEEPGKWWDFSVFSKNEWLRNVEGVGFDTWLHSQDSDGIFILCRLAGEFVEEEDEEAIRRVAVDN